MFNWLFKKRKAKQDMSNCSLGEYKEMIHENREMILKDRAKLSKVQDFISDQMLERISKK